MVQLFFIWNICVVCYQQPIFKNSQPYLQNLSFFNIIFKRSYIIDHQCMKEESFNKKTHIPNY